MKKLLILFLLLSLYGCGASMTESGINSTPSAPDSSVNDTFKITEKAALEIASQYWGIKSGDKDSATGNRYLIMPVESSNDNIAIALKLLVENQFYSTIGSIKIDPYTGEIVNRD